MHRACLLLLLSAWLAIGGCSGERPPAGEPGRAVTSLEEISGPWDIVRFDGYAPMRLHDGVRRAYVDVGSEGVGYAIECNFSGNPARIDEAGVLHDTGGELKTQTLMACGPEGELREGRFFAFFSRKPRVSWAAGGRLRLANEDAELILERPEVRRMAHVPRVEELSGRWVPQGALQLTGGGYSGGGFQGASIVTISPGRIAYSGCGGFAFAFRYTAEGKLDTDGGPDRATCGMDSQSTMLLRVLRADPLVERMAGGGIALSAGQEVITMQSEAELRRLQNMPFVPPAGARTPPRPPQGR